MKLKLDRFVRAFVLASLVMQAGCYGISVDVKPNPAAAHFPPSDTSDVKVLRIAPPQKYVSLAEIVVRPGRRLTDLQLDMKLRETAAEFGADAALITDDKNYAVASAPRGGFSNTYQTMGTNVRVVKAEAIRYSR